MALLPMQLLRSSDHKVLVHSLNELTTNPYSEYYANTLQHIMKDTLSKVLTQLFRVEFTNWADIYDIVATLNQIGLFLR